MKTSSACAYGLCLVVGSCSPGCGALSSASDPGAARFFSIDPAPDAPGAVPAAPVGPEEPVSGLRLGRVTGAPHLEQRVVFRNSPNEVNYYREIRWTEPPERFLERLLAHVLFEHRAMPRLVGGGGATLDVRLVAFDEIRVPNRLARAEVVASLRNERRVVWEETMTVDCPVIEAEGGDAAGRTIEALVAALRGVAARIADRVQAADGGR